MAEKEIVYKTLTRNLAQAIGNLEKQNTGLSDEALEKMIQIARLSRDVGIEKLYPDEVVFDDELGKLFQVVDSVSHHPVAESAEVSQMTFVRAAMAAYNERVADQFEKIGVTGDDARAFGAEFEAAISAAFEKSIEPAGTEFVRRLT